MSSTISERSAFLRRPPRPVCAAAAIGFVAALSVSAPAGAQSRIVIDGSLAGEARAIEPTGPQFTIPAENGRARGGALFHSFSTFDLRSGDRAVFGVTPETARIISRVTGADGAFIDGRIRTDVTRAVDFWMISPNGLIVGPNAVFDTNGAVHLATADRLDSPGGGTFPADPATALTLTSAPPSAFGFEEAPGRLEVSGDGLAIVRGDLTLAGGAVEVRDARIGAATGAQILIAGAGAGDVVSLTRRRADAPPAGQATLGGRITIAGDPAAAPGEATSVAFDGSGVIALEARGVRIEGAEVALGAVGEQTGGDGVLISGRRIEILGDGAVRTSTAGPEDAGDIAVVGFERLLIDRGARTGAFPGETVVESETRNPDDPERPLTFGAAGDVTVSGDRLVLRNRGRIFSNTLSSGPGGRVDVSVVSLRLLSGGQIGGGVADADQGRGAEGVGGAVRIRASDAVRISGIAEAPAPSGETRADEPSGVFTSTEAASGGAAGVISIRTPTLVLEDDGEIASETRNRSDGGRISIRADDVALSGSAEITTNVVDPRAPGGGAPAGDPLVLGDAGDIRLRRLSDDGAASLTLRSDAAVASDGSIGARSEAGSVSIRNERVEIGPGARVTTNASTDTGGDIILVGREIVRVDGAVTTSVENGDGDGGRIFVAGDVVLAAGGALIQANAGDVGDGGRVRIETGAFLRDFAGAVVEARGGQGAPGSILILGNAGADTGEAAELDSAFLDAFALVDDFCVAAVTEGSSLVLSTLSAAPSSGAPAPALFGSAVPAPGEGDFSAGRTGGALRTGGAGFGAAHPPLRLGDAHPCDPG